MTPRIQKAIDIFLDAINEGTLAKGTCAACAVGNLIAKELNYKPTLDFPVLKDAPNIAWVYLFATVNNKQTRMPSYEDDNIKKGKQQLGLTDFTIEELANIEYTFETNSIIDVTHYKFYSKEQIRADQIKGLEAVVKVMLEFDDCKEEVKEVFTSKAELIPV